MEGPPGQRGAVGPRGADGSGTGGNDGSSSIFMYRASATTLRSIPTGGSWDVSEHNFTPPRGWYETYAEAETAGNAGDPIYIAAVYLSGTGDDVNAYSHPIRMTGERGPIGPTGPASTIPGPRGRDGQRGRAGLDGKFVLPVYLAATTKPNVPTFGSYSSGFIAGLGEWRRESPDPIPEGQNVYTAEVEINPNTGDTNVITVYQSSGKDGRDGRDGRDGVPNLPEATQTVRFAITADTTDRMLHSSRANTDATIWQPWSRQTVGGAGVQDVRGNFIGVGNPNIATQRYTPILNDASVTAGQIGTGFTGIPRNPQTFRPLRITPSSDARATAGQTPKFKVIGGLRAATQPGQGTQFSSPFRLSEIEFDFDVNADGTIQPMITPIDFADFQRIEFENFATGTADIEFAEGIRIAQDGLYRVLLQLDTVLAGSTASDPGELVITLYVEDENGGEVGSFITQGHDIEAALQPDVSFPDLIPFGPRQLSEGDHIYFVYSYQSTRGDPPIPSPRPPSYVDPVEDLMTIRVNEHPGVDERLEIIKYVGGGTGGGTEGPEGESAVRLWTRASSTPNTPRVSDLSVDANGNFTSLRSEGTLWHVTPPPGSDDLYELALGRRGTTLRIIGTPQNLTGPPGPRGDDGAASTVPGPKGDKGDSETALWFLGGTTAPRTPVGLTVNSTGAWTNLVDQTRTWSIIPGQPSGPSQRLYKQNFEIDYSTTPNPTVTPKGPVLQEIVPGAQGEMGEGGNGIRSYYLRTSTLLPRPGAPTGITYINRAWTAPVPATWGQNVIPGGSGQYIWMLQVFFQVGVNGIQGQIGPVLISAPPGATGANGFGYQNFYIASTNDTVSRPNIDYNGTQFSSFAPWSMTVPSTPSGANIFEMPVRYQVGVPQSEVEEGVILAGRVPGTAPPPSGSTTYSNGITYGLSDDSNNPTGTALQTRPFSLMVGGTHTTESLTLPLTTATGDNWYITAPTGLTVTGIIGTIEGEFLSEWTRVGATQTWIYTVGFADAQKTITITVRRDN